MATITVKNIPDDIYQLLKENAKANHRSTNNEVILAIKMAVMHRHVAVDAVLEDAHALKERILQRRDGEPITSSIEVINHMRNERSEELLRR